MAELPPELAKLRQAGVAGDEAPFQNQDEEAEFWRAMEPHSLHLNVNAMRFCRATMDDLGMHGIPAAKISSNDGWHVLVEEIDAALAVDDAASEGQRSVLEADAVWRTWIGWLRSTREHDGFFVY